MCNDVTWQLATASNAAYLRFEISNQTFNFLHNLELRKAIFGEFRRNYLKRSFGKVEDWSVKQTNSEITEETEGVSSADMRETVIARFEDSVSFCAWIYFIGMPQSGFLQPIWLLISCHHDQLIPIPIIQALCKRSVGCHFKPLTNCIHKNNKKTRYHQVHVLF